jgi:hypothetical protein
VLRSARRWRGSVNKQTGPRTAAGKVQAAVNGKRRQTSEHSVREVCRSLAEFTALANGLSQARRLIAALLHGED